MHIPKTLLSVFLMIVVSGATWMYAQQQRTSHMLSAEDYLEIQQLYYLYARDVDPGSEWDASWMYTEDGTFNSGETMSPAGRRSRSSTKGSDNATRRASVT